MAPHLESVTALLASNCTLRCGYCYQRPGGSQVMPWSALRRSLDALLASPSPSLTVEFSGGEALLAFPLIERAVRYVERARGTRDVRYELTTNGTLLDRERLEFLDVHGFVVRLSYHPVPGARGRGDQAVFRRLDRVLDQLRGHGALWRERLHVSVTVGRRELAHLAQTVRYLIRKEVRDIGLSPAFGLPGGHVGDVARIERQFDRISRMVDECRRRSGRVPLRLYRRSVEGSAPSPFDLRCDGARGAAIAVDPAGQAWGCVMLAGARPALATTGAADGALRLAASSPLWRFALGDVREEGFARRLRSYASRVARAGLFRGRRTQRSSHARCGACRFLASCPVCPVANAFGPEAAAGGRVSDFVCAFTRVSQRQAERSPRGPSLVARLSGRAPVPALVRDLRRHAQRTRGATGRRAT